MVVAISLKRSESYENTFINEKNFIEKMRYLSHFLLLLKLFESVFR